MAWLHQTHTLIYFAFVLANELLPSSRKTLLAAREVLNARIFNPLLYLLTRGNNVAFNKLTTMLPNIFENFAVLNPHGEEISYKGTDLALRCEEETIGFTILTTDASVELMNSGCTVYSKLETLCCLLKGILVFWKAMKLSGEAKIGGNYHHHGFLPGH